LLVRTFTVTSTETASAMLDVFNGFHDGFMQSIAITSRDRIEDDLSQTCTGAFDVEIAFAHYNYASGDEPFHPYTQVIRGRFSDVRNIRLGLTDEFLGNTIIRLAVQEVEGRLELWLGRHAYLDAERRYEFREAPMFSFADATFTEEE
jgi:hypothetical protein